MIRILVVDDQELVRRGIVALLGFEPDLAVVAQAGDGEACLERLQQQAVDVVLMDIRMPRLNGLEALRRLRAEGIAVPVVLLTTFDEPLTLAQGRAAGAQACLLKDIDQEGLVSAIRIVAAGGVVEAARSEPPPSLPAVSWR